MDFLTITLFMVLYYVRPQEWIGLLAATRPVKLTMVAAIAAMIFRDAGFSVRDLVRTPHDWMVLALFTWIILASPAPLDTFQLVKNRLVFYIVTVQALRSWERIEQFMVLWGGMIFVVAALAVASQFGFDPMGSYDKTLYAMKGRLVLNTSIFNNPNALGHAVLPVLPMVYYLCVWHRGILLKEASLLVFPIPLWCIYLTQSKGSFLSGAATLVASAVLGRPRIVQVFFLLLCLLVGADLLQRLPRMSELQDRRGNEAMMGRVFAWRYGLEVLYTRDRGLGFERFIPTITRERHWRKASHSSYVQVGAELGRGGLFLWLGVVYCCLRTLLTTRCTGDREERLRRLLLVTALAYLCSSWMVDFAYRATYFIQAAVIASFHRLAVDSSAREKRDSCTEDETTEGGKAERVEGSEEGEEEGDAGALVAQSDGKQCAQDAGVSLAMGWNRLGIVDVALVAVMTNVTIRVWHHVTYNF